MTHVTSDGVVVEEPISQLGASSRPSVFSGALVVLCLLSIALSVGLFVRSKSLESVLERMAASRPAIVILDDMAILDGISNFAPTGDPEKSAEVVNRLTDANDRLEDAIRDFESRGFLVFRRSSVAGAPAGRTIRFLEDEALLDGGERALRPELGDE